MRPFLLASALAAITFPFALQGQATPRALVYCPPVDMAGCDRIVDALSGGGTLAGTFAQVDRGYDGRDGTIDLRTADLNHYAVFVVPSLADGAASQPYAFLRSHRAASRLKAHLIGRVAAWSGTPDQGIPTAEKETLLRNLAAWSSEPFQSTGVTGVVVLQDHSEPIAQRYSWLSGISRMAVTADATIGTYSEAQSLSEAGEQILDAGEGALAYANMASFGFTLGSSGAGVAGAAYAGTATDPDSERQIVLVTYEGAPGGALTAGPAASTISISGSQWQPGDVVRIMVHEDPYLHVNRTLTATADGAGSFSLAFTPAAHEAAATLTFIGLGSSTGQLAKSATVDGPRDGGTEIFLQAHQDDWQLFFGDRAAIGAYTGGKAVFIYTTAGDAGSTSDYWLAREQGAQASIDAITPPGPWACAPQTIGTRAIRRCAKANTVSYYLRLPDGNGEGEGYAGRGSLAQLRGLGRSITALDGSASYASWADLIATIAAIIALESEGDADPAVSIHAPEWEVATNGGDHSDHIATGEIARQLSWGHAWNRDWYIGYQNLFQDVNVTGDAYAEKWSTIVAYDDLLRGNYGTILGPRAEDWARRTIVRSEPSSGVPLPAPAPVTGLVATPVDAGRIDLHWSDTFDDEEGFRVERASDVGGSAGGFHINAHLPPNTTSWSSTGLPANTRYWYRVRAIGADGSSAYSAEISATTPGSCSPPAISSHPTSASGIVGGTVTLSVTATGDGLAYQWRRAGQPIEGATAAQYEIGPLAMDDAGTHDVVVSNSCGAVTSASVTVTVTKAPATVQFAELTSTYTGAAHEPHVTTVPADLATTLTYTRSGSPVTAPVDAGEYLVTASVTDASYEGTATATITIARATPAFSSLRSASITYGASSVSLSGTLNAGVAPSGEVVVTLGTGAGAQVRTAALDASGGFSTTFPTATLPASATAYPISYRYDGDGNFAPASDNSTGLTVEQAVVTAVVSDPGFAYDGTPKSANVAVSAPAPLSGLAVAYTRGGVVVTPVDAGSYDVVITLQDPNYRLAGNGSVAGTLVIARRPVVVTAHGSVRQYGDPNAPSPSATIACTTSDGAEGDASCPIAQDGMSASATTSAGVASPVGTYAVVPAVVDPRNRISNYDPTLVPGQVVVQPAPLQINVPGQEKTYGEGAVLSGTITGIANGDAVTASYASAGTPPDANAGTYPITATLVGDAATLANYTLTGAVTGTLTVRPAPLTITADDHSRQYDGRAFTGFTARYDGLVLGQAPSVLAGSLTFTGSAVGATAAGSYAVTPAGLTSSNYDIRFVPGTLVITKAMLSVTAGDAARTYGDPNPALTGTVIGDEGDGITAVYTTTAGVGSGVGRYPIVPVLSDPNGRLANYVVESTNGTLSITPAPLAAVAENATKVYGQTIATFAGSLTGARNGDAVSAVFASDGGPAARAAGSYPITAIVQADAATLGNYTVTTTPGVLTILRAPLTITADDVNKQYDGQPVAAFPVRYTGFMNGETPSVLGGSLVFTGSAVGATAAGTYTIVPSGLASGNYELSFASGTLAIARAPLTVTANDATKTYGQLYGAFTGSVDGVQNADPITVTYSSSGSAAASGAGPHPITPLVGGEPAVLGNYVISIRNGTLTVAPAPLTVTADDQAKQFDGQPFTGFTARYDGLVAGDGTTALGGSLAFGGPAVGATSAGEHAITVGGLTSPNYSISYANGTLRIGQAALTVVADNATRAYGAPNPAFTGTMVGLAAGGRVTVTYASTAATTSNVGSYDIVPTLSDPFGELGNYAVALTPGRLTVSPAPLTVRPANATKRYGVELSELTGSLEGILNADAVTATYSSAGAASVSVVGTYPITATLLGDATTLRNYDVTAHAATLTVTRAPLTVTAASATREYGMMNPVFTGSVSGLAAGDVMSAAYASAATATSAVGTYPIVPTLNDPAGRAANYDVSLVSGSLAVTPAPLAITANDASREYGAPAPPLTGTVTGIRNDDAISATYASAATPASAVGTYDIDATVVATGGASVSNYSVTITRGTLRVTPAPLTITPTDRVKTYGQLLTGLTGTIGGIRNGDDVRATYASAGSAPASAVGSYPITATLDGAATTLANYTATANVGTLRVDPASLTITANDASRPVGAANPAFTATFSGFVNGETEAALGGTLAFGTAATAASPAGDYAITPAGVSSTNYSIQFVAGTLRVIAKATPIIAWSPADVTIPAALGAAQLNAIAYGTDGTTTLTGTYAYSSNGTVVTTGTVLPPGAPTPLTVVFTPTGAHANSYGPATMTVSTFNVLNKIDITPGSTSNAISLSGTQKEIIVGVVSSANFDARTMLVSGTTPTLGNGQGVETVLARNTNGTPKTGLTDLNADGRLDVLLYFPKASLISNGDVTSGTTQLILQGQLASGVRLKGADKVTVLP